MSFPLYNPNNILKVLHNAARPGSRGDHEFALPCSLESFLPEDANVSSSSCEFLDAITDTASGSISISGGLAIARSDDLRYVYGLVMLPLFLVVVYLLFLFVCLPCTLLPCWKRPNCRICPLPMKLFFFYAGLMLSIFSLFSSLKGRQYLDDGLNSFRDVLTNVGDYTAKLAGSVTQVSSAATAIDISFFNTKVLCSNDAQQFGFQGELDALSNDPTASVRNILDQISQALGDIQPVIQDVLDSSQEQYYLKRFAAITASAMLFLITVGITETIRVLVYYKRIDEESRLARFSNAMVCCECICCGTVGLLAITITTLFCAALAPLVSLSADLCLPDITTNILEEFAGSVPNVNQPADLCFLDVDATSLVDGDDIPSLLAAAGNIFCHYTRCEGQNTLLSALGIEVNGTSNAVEVEVLNDIVQEIEELLNNISALLNETSDCKIAVIESSDAVSNILDQVAALVPFIECEEVTPLVREAMDDALCNGYVSGLGAIYATWTAAVMGMMIAMVCFGCLNLDLVEDYDDVEEVEEFQAEEMKNDIKLSERDPSMGAPLTPPPQFEGAPSMPPPTYAPPLPGREDQKIRHSQAPPPGDMGRSLIPNYKISF